MVSYTHELHKPSTPPLHICALKNKKKLLEESCDEGSTMLNSCYN